MLYGAKMLQWAKVKAEPAGTLPSYDTPVNLGALNQVADNPTYNEAKGYGDNTLKVHVSEFKEAALDAQVTELSNANAAAITGAKIDTESGKDLHFNAEDNAPYGGLGFYINKMTDTNKKVYQGIFYPKVKAVMQGEAYTTKGESITLANHKLKFTASACNNGDWKILSDDFHTEQEAIGWVNEKVKATA